MSREVNHPFFARFLACVTTRAEGGEEDEIRCELLAGLSGRVIEVGSGSGPNFRLYPETVSELVAVEPEDYLRAKAEEAAAPMGRPIRVMMLSRTGSPSRIPTSMPPSSRRCCAPSQTRPRRSPSCEGS